MGDPQHQATELDALSAGPLSVEEIIAQLEDAQDAPRLDAIRAARQRREEVVPRLIEVLQETTAKARSGQFRDGDAHWVALYLLAELRATEALPAVLEAVSLPGELPFDLFGDVITEDLARILLSLEIDLETLDSLLGNERLNQYVRWQAAEAIVSLVLDGQLPRAEGVERLRRHLRAQLDGRRNVAEIGSLIINLSCIWPVEAESDIKEAFRRHLVDPWDIRWDQVEEALAEGENGMRESATDRRSSRITDAVRELECWPSYAESKAEDDEFSSPEGAAEDDEDFDDGDAAHDDDWADSALPEPLRAETRIGRNEVCPCGSGKKYKKCCGRPGAR